MKSTSANPLGLIGKYLALTILLLAACYVARAQTSIDNYALTGVTIIDANHRESLPHQTVLVSKDLISDIFTDGSRPIPDTFSVLKMDGKFLLPGLIDSHVHMATDPSGVDNRADTLDVLRRMLFSGITSVRDMAGDARTLASLSRDASTGDLLSPDIYYSALMAGPKFFSDPRTIASSKGFSAGKAPFMRGVTDASDLRLAVAEAKGTGATGIKLYANLSSELARKIAAEAKDQGMIVWAHAWLNDAKPSDLVKAGISPLSHASLFVRENVDPLPVSWRTAPHDSKFWDSVTSDFNALFELMKEHQTILDATILTYKQLGEREPKRQYNYEIAKRITAAAYKAGVMLDAGTDDDQTAFVQKEIELLVKDAGLLPIDAIIAGTLNGAKALRIDGTRGTVSTGKIANLLIVDKNPLQNIDNIESVYLVIKNGRLFRQ